MVADPSYPDVYHPRAEITIEHIELTPDGNKEFILPSWNELPEPQKSIIKKFTSISHIWDKMNCGYLKPNLSWTFLKHAQTCSFVQKILDNLLKASFMQLKKKHFFLFVFNVCQKIWRKISMNIKTSTICLFAALQLMIALL